MYVYVYCDSTDFQERASATCTGLCMFAERRPYNECFYLCNWFVIPFSSPYQCVVIIIIMSTLSRTVDVIDYIHWERGTADDRSVGNFQSIYCHGYVYNSIFNNILKYFKLSIPAHAQGITGILKDKKIC